MSKTPASGFAIEGIGLVLFRAPDGQISERLRCAISQSAVQNAVKSFARKSEFHEPIQRDLGRPDGKQKIIRFSLSKNGVSSRHPAS
jgi:hypothetical protein